MSRQNQSWADPAKRNQLSQKRKKGKLSWGEARGRKRRNERIISMSGFFSQEKEGERRKKPRRKKKLQETGKLFDQLENKTCKKGDLKKVRHFLLFEAYSCLFVCLLGRARQPRWSAGAQTKMWYIVLCVVNAKVGHCFWLSAISVYSVYVYTFAASSG